jgi:hypothetical protein
MPAKESQKSEPPPTPDWALKFRADYHSYSKWWFVALILLIPGGLVIGAFVSNRYTWQEGLGSGLFFSFLLLVLMLNMFKKMDKTWKGRVVAKYARDIQGTRNVGRQRHRGFVRTAYRVEIRTDAGRREVIDVHPDAFRLFQEGDELIKYRGLPFPDRLLRSGETMRMCAACGRPYDIAASKCPACRFRSPFRQEP